MINAETPIQNEGRRLALRASLRSQIFGRLVGLNKINSF